MGLTTKQIEMQKVILLSVHKGYTLEEIKKKEALILGCQRDTSILCAGHRHRDGYNLYLDDGRSKVFYKIDKCFGLLPTINRVLTSMGNYCWIDGEICSTDGGCYMRENICSRKLLNDNGTDATLRDQPQETQDIIYNILCK